MKGFCVAVLVMFLAVTGLAAQTPDPQIHPRIAVVTFDLIWDAVTPQEFTVTARADGGASYVSRNPLKAVPAGQEREPSYLLQFTMSPANQTKIFKLAQQANFFNGNFDYKGHPVANTGKKTLSYADLTRNFQTTYNHSENKAIQQLTELFQGISSTIEFGRKLQFKHKYDKLGLEDELKAMEASEANHYLAELQIIAPTLQSIADDPTVLNIARERARRLLKKVPK